MPDTTSLLPQALSRCLGPSLEADGYDSGQVDWVRRQLKLAQYRAPRQRLVDVRPTTSGDVEIAVVNDDMPLLVESVLAAVESRGLTVTEMDHPVVAVVRSDDGVLRKFGAEQDSAATTESWMHLVAVSQRGDVDRDSLHDDIVEVTDRVADVDRDAPAMRSRMMELSAEYADTSAGTADRSEYAELLRWFAANHFQSFGYRHLLPDGSSREGGLGVWRTDTVAAHYPSVTTSPLLPKVSRIHLVTGVHRSNFPILVQVPVLTSSGEYAGEHRFLGAFTSSGQHQAILDIPVLRRKVHAVLAAADVEEDSFAGQSMIELLQNYPLPEMFAVTDDELRRQIVELLDAVSGRSLRLFVRADPDGGVATALVYLPRDRYNTASRQALQGELVEALGGTGFEYTARVSEIPLARLHVLVNVGADTARSLDSLDTGSPGQVELQARLAESIRTWDERVRAYARAGVVPGVYKALGGVDALLRALPSLSEEYKEQREPRAALADLVQVSRLEPGEISVTLNQSGDSGRWVFTLYLCAESARLTDVLPVLHSLGLDVLDEHPHRLARPDGSWCWAYEFGVALTSGMSVDSEGLSDLEDRFTDAFGAIWRRDAEVDAFNELVIRCGLDWRSVAMLRAYGRYLRQCGLSYTTSHVAGILGRNGDVTRGLVELFRASFDPAAADDDRREAAATHLRDCLGEVISLDADRILSAFTVVVTATSRTNFYVTRDGRHREVMSFKLRPREIPQAPEPRPLHEIFVYSSRVEGVHLRFGMVARGGLRWSDRREDYRTEILGLVKAQAVKNAVIVPVGAKGGFVVKRPPASTGDPSHDRGAYRAEGVACYRAFIDGLLDITDNIDHQQGTVVPARSVIRRDGDDPYLVVAADKGTAAFSDIANEAAAQHEYWLGDAFASGGSAGYDHKAMGITARGAWESVKRHFREMGIDTQSQDFTAVGIGDMSGDVFGNGMLLSEHIRLVAAFDHRDIFVDPRPDAATSFRERSRLFEQPRSSWADYNRSLISEGGGVWSRDRKSIPVSPQMRSALGLEDGVTALSPPELIRAVLLAPVDLLWNGGIGTYVKASTQSDAEVGDKANDAIRVNANDLRAKVIGEGGNLGLTELGRIEFDLAGGRVNTDALDNSAGVDCSDHEVNIKILLDAAVSSGELSVHERNPLLESMTDEVADLVLADNISQNSELGFSRTCADDRVDVHTRQLADLAQRYGVDLTLEALPKPGQLRKRYAGETRRGLTSPELATLMAHVKLAAKSDLLSTDLPDNEFFENRLRGYFPDAVSDRFATGIRNHRLRREIVATTLVNDVVDKAGATHLFRLREATGASTEEGVRAYVVAGSIFGMDDVFDRIVHAPAPVESIDEMTLYARRLVYRVSRWLLGTRPQPLAIAAEITRYRARISELSTVLDGWLGPSSRREVDERIRHYRNCGAPAELARDVALSLHRFCLLDIIDAAEIADRDATEVGELYYTVMESFGIEDLLAAVSELEHGEQWHALARLALRDDLHSALRAVTLKVLEVGEPDESADEKIAEWEASNTSRLERVRSILGAIAESEIRDLATLSVAARQLRSIVR